LIDPEEADYLERYGILRRYLRFRKAGDAQHKEVREYCHHPWEATKGTGNMKRILGNLPSVIRNMITLEMTQMFFTGVRVFQSLEPAQRAQITHRMAFKMYAPGDVVFREGDEADRLWFFRRGIIAVGTHDGTVYSRPCGDGDVHGEHEVLRGVAMQGTVRALTYVECWTYPIGALRDVLARRKDMRNRVLDDARVNDPDAFPEIIGRIVPNAQLRAAYENRLERHRART